MTLQSVKEDGTVARADVEEACRLLGFDPSLVHSIHIDSDRLEALLYACDSEGARVMLPRSAGDYLSDLQFAKRVVVKRLVP